MQGKWISLSQKVGHEFVYLPPGLDRPYLEEVLSQALGKEIALSRCTATNLCADQDGGVSHSGATVLRLHLEPATGQPLDLVAKILSPDAVNLFKCDRRFDSRLAEIAWAAWWGRQGVPYVARIYDTRADRQARVFWILQEHFPQVGWSLAPTAEIKRFSAASARLRQLFETVARLHAYSRNRIDELLSLFSGHGLRAGHLCTPPQLLDALTQVFADTALLSTIGVTERERQLLDT